MAIGVAHPITCILVDKTTRSSTVVRAERSKLQILAWRFELEWSQLSRRWPVPMTATRLSERGTTMDHQDTPSSESQDPGQDVRLSYKFQRLRERLRQAISSGELSGKLPGERQLSRRFRVNAKTLSKALTDLAAEGLLERSIGRGTFVRGQQAAAPATEEKWLL